MTLSDHQNKFMTHLAMLILEAQDLGFKVTGGELMRTREQQKVYYTTGKSKTMNSYHLNKLAIDLNFFKDGKLTYDKKDLQKLGDYWESLDKLNSWGGNWKSFLDTPHFERRAK